MRPIKFMMLVLSKLVEIFLALISSILLVFTGIFSSKFWFISDIVESGSKAKTLIMSIAGAIPVFLMVTLFCYIFISTLISRCWLSIFIFIPACVVWISMLITNRISSVSRITIYINIFLAFAAIAIIFIRSFKKKSTISDWKYNDSY